MATPVLDFSHLSPEQRIELAELAADGDPGEPWQRTIRER
jgi:hypothetical protein